MSRIREAAERGTEVIRERRDRVAQRIAEMQENDRILTERADAFVELRDEQDAIATRISGAMARVGEDSASVTFRKVSEEEEEILRQQNLPVFKRYRQTHSRLTPLAINYPYRNADGSPGTRSFFIEYFLEEGQETPTKEQGKPNPQTRIWPLTAHMPYDSKDGGYTRTPHQRATRQQALSQVGVRILASNPGTTRREDMEEKGVYSLRLLRPVERLMIDRYEDSRTDRLTPVTPAFRNQLAAQDPPNEATLEMMGQINGLLGMDPEARYDDIAHLFPGTGATPTARAQFGPPVPLPPRI